MKILLDSTFPLEFVWGPMLGFIALTVIAVGLIGALSRSMAIPAVGGYCTFAYLSLQADNVWLTTVLYVTLVTILIGTAMKIWRLEGTGDT